MIFHRVNGLPLRAGLDLVDHGRVAILHENHLRVPGDHLLHRHGFETLNGRRRHVNRPRMGHHQPGIFTGAVGSEFRVSHVGANTFFRRESIQAVADPPAALIDGVNQRLRFRLLVNNLANQRDPLAQPAIVSLLFIVHRGVHFRFLTRGIVAQGDSDYRNTQAADLVDHLLRRVVGDKHHLRFQGHQLFRVNVGEIAQHRFVVQFRSQTRVAVAQLLFPVCHHPHDLIGGVHLHQ